MSESEQFPIRLAEEVILVMLDEQTGYLEMAPSWDFACVMAGAVIADLALERRIETDLEALYLADPTLTGDSLLDPTLKDIAKAISESAETADAQFWIERNTARADEIVATTLERLVERHILSYETGGFWRLSRSVARSGTYPTTDVETRREAKARILNLILTDEIPDPRDAMLVALMHTCGVFRMLLSPEDYEERLERIELLSRLDLLGRAVASAVRDSTALPRTRRVLQPKPIPRLSVFDLLRLRSLRTGNVAKAFHEILSKHGPVVRFPFKVKKGEMIGLIGADVNRWFNRHGRFYLRSKDYLEDFEACFGASRTLPSMDGAEHYRMRKELSTAYSRSTLAQNLPELYRQCRRSLARWEAGAVFSAVHAFRNHISSQVSHVMIGVDCSDYVDDLLTYQHRALMVHVQGALPKFTLSTPKMRRVRKRFAELQEAIASSHTPAQRKGKAPDLADALLGLHKNDPQFLPETDLPFAFIATMVASLYMGSGLGFALYWMVRHPELYRKIREEAEQLFGNGREPTAEDFTPETMDVTHRLCMESARLTPVIPAQMRTTMNECIISGYELPARTRVLIVQAATHHDPALFPEPEKFDIDRYLPDRAEHRQPAAYAPFGLGTHSCLGSRWVDMQMAINLLLIAYHLKVEIEPADYKLRMNPVPTVAPDRKLHFRVAEVIHPV